MFYQDLCYCICYDSLKMSIKILWKSQRQFYQWTLLKHSQVVWPQGRLNPGIIYTVSSRSLFSINFLWICYFPRIPLGVPRSFRVSLIDTHYPGKETVHFYNSSTYNLRMKFWGRMSFLEPITKPEERLSSLAQLQHMFFLVEAALPRAHRVRTHSECSICPSQLLAKIDGLYSHFLLSHSRSAAK